MSNEVDLSAWPELIYRFAEHYKWETQHLKGSTANFYARIRKQEVPLNFLFNILLRLASQQTISAVLRSFGLDSEDSADAHVDYPWSTASVQPDIRLESMTARFLIEVKTTAKIKLEQIQKYLLLHAEMEIVFGKKHPFLLFVTANDFAKCWQPARELTATDSVQDFLQRKMTNHSLSENLLRRFRRRKTFEKYDAVKNDSRYAATTWQSIGSCLAVHANQLREADPHNIEVRLIDDFVSDLRRRELMV